jgi:hypothetical protein
MVRWLPHCGVGAKIDQVNINMHLVKGGHHHVGVESWRVWGEGEEQQRGRDMPAIKNLDAIGPKE